MITRKMLDSYCRIKRAFDSIWEKIPALDALEQKAFSTLKIIVAIFLIYYIINIGCWIFDEEDGIVIQPFEIVGISDNSLNGKPLADLLRCELQHIKDINGLNQQEPPFFPRKDDTGDPIVIEAQARSILNPKPYVEFSSLPLAFGSESLDFRLSQVGSIGVGQSSLSVGQVLLSLKELSGNHLNTISCSLQRYGHTIRIVAILEYRRSPDKEIVGWQLEKMLSGNNSSIEEQIPALINDLAFQIAHKLGKQVNQPDSDYPSTWQAFKYLIQGKEAYFNYIATSNISELDNARDLVQLASCYEPGYSKPFDLLSNIGFSYLSTDKSDELENANKIFQNISYQKPFESAFGLGLVYSRMHQYQKSLNRFEEAIKLNSSDAAAWGNKGAVLANLGRYDEAIDAYDRAIQQDPKNAWIWYNKGTTLYNLGRYNESIPVFEIALELDQNSSCAWLAKGMALCMHGRYNESLYAYENAIALNPKSSISWSNKGNLLLKMGRYSESIQYFETALELDPKYSLAWSNKGVALSMLGRHNEALHAHETALALNPDYALDWLNKGATLFDLGRYNESFRAYETVLNINPKSASDWSYRGRALGILGRYNESLAAYEKSLDLNPNYPPALSDKAWTLYLLNRYNDSREFAQNALELNQNVFSSWETLVSDLRALRSKREALEFFNASLELDNTNPEVLYHREQLLNAFGHDKQDHADRYRTLALGEKNSTQNN